MKRAWPATLFGVLFVAAFLRRSEEPSGQAPPWPAPETALPRAERRWDPLPSAPTPAAEVELRPENTAEPESESLVEEAPCPAPLRWLLNAQGSDGSWGDGATALDGVLIGKPGLTGLALLSFLGAGYSHLSKDRYDGLCMGDAVKNGLRLLLEDQREDGLFRSSRSGLDHALAALALSEAYGLTGSNLFKDQAQAAVAALVSLQLQDGSWGDGPTTTWAADVLKSAEIGGLEFPKTAYDGLRAYYERRGMPDAREMIARIFIDKNKADPVNALVAWRLVASPPDAARSLHDVYFETRALFQYDGPSGRHFRAWSEPFKKTVREREGFEGARGSDRVIHTSLTALCWSIYYR